MQQKNCKVVIWLRTKNLQIKLSQICSRNTFIANSMPNSNKITFCLQSSNPYQFIIQQTEAQFIVDLESKPIQEFWLSSMREGRSNLPLMTASDMPDHKLFESEGLFGHDVIKVFTADFSSVRSSSLKHLLEFLDVHCFS